MRGSRSTRTTGEILAGVAGLASIGLLPWLGKPVFPDESASLSSASLSWAALWQHSRVIDLVLLPYYALLHLWVQVSGSIEWARLLSLVAFGVTVFLVGRVGARLGGRSCGLLAAILAGTNPLLVTAALSARPYALSTLAATASVAAFLRWLDCGGVRWAWWSCAASIVTALLHVFAVLAPLSVLLAALGLGLGVPRRRWRAVIAPIGLVLAAALTSAVLGAGQRSQIAWIPYPFHGRQLVRAIAGPAAGGHGLYAALILFAGAMSIAVCARAWRRDGVRPAPLDLRMLAVLAAWAVLPTAILVAGSLARPVFLDRYVTASVPGLALALGLLTASAFDVIAARLAERPRIMVAGAGLGILALVLFFAFSVPAARLSYSQAIAQGPPGDRRAAPVVAAARGAPRSSGPASPTRREESGRRRAAGCLTANGRAKL